MTPEPKEKAKELVEKFQKDKIIQYTHYAGANTEYSCLSEMEAKYCAKICVNEILEAMLLEKATDDWLDEEIDYWNDVKKEIEKL